jgi:hypothetical protein
VPGPSPLIAASSRRLSTARSSMPVTPARVSAVTARPGNPRSRIVRAGPFPGDLIGMTPHPNRCQPASVSIGSVVLPCRSQRPTTGRSTRAFRDEGRHHGPSPLYPTPSLDAPAFTALHRRRRQAWQSSMGDAGSSIPPDGTTEARPQPGRRGQPGRRRPRAAPREVSARTDRWRRGRRPRG